MLYVPAEGWNPPAVPAVENYVVVPLAKVIATGVALVVLRIGHLERASALPLEDPVLYTMVKLYSCIARAQWQSRPSTFWVDM